MAVLGDIHSNLEALNAIVHDARERGAARFICTGDVVGYGANPAECLRIIRDLKGPVVLGNHDFYAATRERLMDFNVQALNSILWTREQLNDEQKHWLSSLPLERPLDGGGASRSFHLVHSTLLDPVQWRYVSTPEQAASALRAQLPDIVFYGHTHIPAVFSFHETTGVFESECPAAEGVYVLKPGWKYLINPGSAGQPRDRNARASYALVDPDIGTVEIRRIEYDITAVQQKIKAAGLPLRNAERLSAGR